MPTRTPQKGAAIRAIRRRACLTQVEVASKADITQSYLSLLEAERRSASQRVIDAIARALDVPADVLSRSEQAAS
jgi:transcriptional regulator with XRE-family HTH domain